MNVTRNDLRREEEELARQLADPQTAKQPNQLAKLAKRQKEVGRLLVLFDNISIEEEKIAELKALLADEENDSLKSLAQDELTERLGRLKTYRSTLAVKQQPADPQDSRAAMIEVRAGAGGDESTLFASELFAMYQRFAESRGWPVELLSTSHSDVGGMKEVIFRIGGQNTYGTLKYEGGTHRVQRVPTTESSGRVHTSTVTVAVLPEAEEVDVELRPEDLRVDVYRSSGPGGQSVNTTDSAVRITHLPTGLTASCQDEKSQHKNRAKALTILRSRLLAARQAEEAQRRGDKRRQQIGTGDRSEKIRTYNFPQDRLTDHRINYTTRGLAKLMAGNLDPLLQALQQADQPS